MQSEEIAKRLVNDFPTYARVALKIEDKDGKLVPFLLNDAQQYVWDKLAEQERNGEQMKCLVLKGRQQGMSTLAQGILCWRCFTQEGQKAFTVAPKMKPAGQELFGKAELMYESLPVAMKPERDSKTLGRRIKLASPLRSLMVVESAEEHEAVGRSGTFQHVHCTEIPFWPKQRETMSALLAVVPNKKGTTVIVESTARGMGNWFHEQWVNAIADMEAGRKPTFLPLFVPWFWTKEYQRPATKLDRPATKRDLERMERLGISLEQILWYRDQEREFGDLVAQEYPDTWEEAFLSTGLPFFHQNILAKHKKAAPVRAERTGRFRINARVAKFLEDDQGELWIWKPPESGHSYVVGIDVSTGRAKDYSTYHVLDAGTLEQVASFQGKIAPDELAVESIVVARLYNNALWVPERNGVGLATVIKGVKDIGYSNVYTHIREDTTKGQESSEYGWTTSTRTRGPMLEQLAEYVHGMRIKINCRRTLDEMEHFIYTDELGKKAEADQGSNDDLVMALAIAVATKDFAGGDAGFEVDYHKPAISRRTGY